MRTTIVLHTPVAALALALSLLAALPAAGAEQAQPFTAFRSERARDPWRTLWEDDLEDGAPGWTHGDDTWIPPKFHVDTYMAYDDPEHEADHSWWCGELNPDFAGGDGYGNSWNQWLELPPVELGIVSVERTTWGAIKGMYRDSSTPPHPEAAKRSVTPALTFRYRYDCEPGYDYVWVEAESLGTWVNLNAGWDGKSGGWQDLGAGGFSLAGYGDPIRVRFRFVSDVTYSDADGLYISDGGGFHVDDICVHDAITGEVFYWEDCEGGAGECTPGSWPPAGDYWHLVDSECQAASGTRAWSVSWPDTTQVAPNLKNWLMTPVIDLGEWALGCTLHFGMQMFMTYPDGGYGGSWQEWGSNDGGETWRRTGWWYGHQCQFSSGPYGPCDYFTSAIPIAEDFGYTRFVRAKWVVLTGEYGCGCDVGACPHGYCRAGITIDDIWVEGYFP
ncbi:MAG: hypothetical protein ABIG03_03610 [Candidatus Eisenbacteria bacterium]